MRPAEGSLSRPARRPAQDGLDRIRRMLRRAPLPVKILIVVACCIICVPLAAFGILAAD